MPAATLTIDPAFTIAPVNRRTFGSFVEHMGRCVYTGIYEPGHPTADEDGFRGDVLELDPRARRHGGPLPRRQLRLRLPLGGRRRPARATAAPARPRLAQRSRPTQFGLDEFIALGAQGRGRADDGRQPRHPRASRRRSTCSSTATTRAAPHLSDLRRAHGAADPYDVRLWCLGNEMDGPWQIGHKTADEYGRLAAETARAMRHVDPDLELVACGSLQRRGCRRSAPGSATVLERRYDLVDYISCTPTTRSTTATRRSSSPRRSTWTASSRPWSRPPTTSAPSSSSSKKIGISFDEWNVWYQRPVPPDRRPARPTGPVAPRR